MPHSPAKPVGLALSGGGAKGAYQVGIVKALADLGVEVSAISGASIGALNGAVLACSPTLREGAERLEALWRTIAEEPPLEENDPTLLRVMNAIGLRVRPAFRNAVVVGKEMRRNLLPSMLEPDAAALVDNGIIRRTLDGYVSPEQLAAGTPLYVSVFPSRTLLESVIGCSLAVLGIKDSPESEFLHVQSLSPEEQHKALLASSAIPFLLKAQEIGGARYTDGGQGGLFRSQGNTPIAPLLEAGCKTVIVTLLNDRSAWNKQVYPDAAIVEIERAYSINRAPLIPDVLDVICFRREKIYSWIDQGYGDAMRSLRERADLTGG